MHGSGVELVLQVLRYFYVEEEQVLLKGGAGVS